MALVRTIASIPETFEDLAARIVKSIPTGFRRVEIIADSYLPNSIKGSERDKRGKANKVLVKSVNSKIPRDFSQFLMCGENKTRMIEIIFQSMKEDRVRVLNTLKTNQLILSAENSRFRISLASVNIFDALISNHEEADTKVI